MSKKNSPTPNLPEQIELTIDSLSYSGGRGVGRYEGIVVFVPDTAPGDRVLARIVHQRKRFCEAELLHVVSPSSERRKPPCPVAGHCGGCAWQHVTYPEQIRQKQKILSASLRRLGDFETREFLSAPAEFYYRNRIQLHIEGSRRGFFAKRSRDLVAIDHCWIAETPINAKLKTLSPAEIAGASKVELAVVEDGELRVMPGARDPYAALFSQVNVAQNEVLKQRVVELIEGTPDWIFDLYCGAGNLSLPIQEKFPRAQFSGIELSDVAIERARKSTSAPINWQAGDVGKVLARTKPLFGTGVIVLDPPRVGADEACLREIVRHHPAQILYVSCDPQTFARDAERLAPAYKLQSVQGLDMFPQTEHVELIARFKALT